MKFKEKDPLVSMEQWFPKEVGAEGGVGEEDGFDYVEYANGRSEVETTSYIFWLDDGNKFIQEELRNTTASTLEKTKAQKDFMAVLVSHTVDGKKCFVTKFGGTDLYGKLKSDFVTLNASDWVLTYQSGRREVLTDKEKQERFE